MTLVMMSSKELGRVSDRLGVIKDALVRRQSNTLDVVILDTGNGPAAQRTIAWTSIDAHDRTHLTANLTAADLRRTSPDTRNGKPFDEFAKDRPDYFSIADRLLGKPVISKGGSVAGEISDLVVNMNDGRLVAALIEMPTGLAKGVNDMPRAVPWSAVSLPPDKSRPAAIDLSREQIAREPAFGIKAPEAPGTVGNYPTPHSGTGTGATGSEPTLDLGGSPITPPAISR